MGIEIITLGRDDEKIHDYLMGTFSDQHRALPISSLNMDWPTDEVTFQILPVDQCQAPSRIHVISQLLRPHTFILSLGTLFATGCWLFVRPSAPVRGNWFLLFLSTLAVLGLHISANLLNDFYDHYRGIDRLSQISGSRVIQSGWMTARQIRRMALIVFALTCLVSLPIFLLRHSLVPVFGIFTAFGVLEFSSNRVGFKYHGLGELILFMLLGPLLTMGFALAVTNQYLVQALWPGILFGLSAVGIYHVRNLRNLMTDAQAGGRTLASRLGFDRAKILLQWISFAELMVAVAFGLFSHRWIVAIPITVLMGFTYFRTRRFLERARSPLASPLEDLQKFLWRVHGALVIFVVVSTTTTIWGSSLWKLF